MYRWRNFVIQCIATLTGACALVTVTTDRQVNVSMAGEQTTLNCQYTMSNPTDPAYIKWYMIQSISSEKLIYSKISTLPTGTAGAGYTGKVTLNGSSLTFLYTNKTDAGTYNCTVENINNNAESATASVYLMIPAMPNNISIQRNGLEELYKNDHINLTVTSTDARPLVHHDCSLDGTRLNLASPNYNVADSLFDPLFGSAVSQIYIELTSAGEKNVTCCVAGTRICSSLSVTVKEATTTGTYITTESSSERIVPIDALTITMVVLAASSFVINLLICIIVYKRFPDEIVVAVTAAVSWVCIILTTCFVVLGDVCGVIAWMKIDPDQQIGIIVMAVILIDLGFFILGVVVGTVRGSKLQKTSSEETRTVVLRKLVHVVWSVATFGGVSVGIVIKYKHKVQDPNTRTANGGRKCGSNSVTPEAHDPPLHTRETSANSKESEASHSKVPLHEEKECVSEKEKEMVPMKEGKKKKVPTATLR